MIRFLLFVIVLVVSACAPDYDSKQETTDFRPDGIVITRVFSSGSPAHCYVRAYAIQDPARTFTTQIPLTACAQAGILTDAK